MIGDRSKGFTLIELMIVIAVIGILLAIAVPGFQEQVRKGRRAEATKGLSEMQMRQERWRTNNATYGNGGAIGLTTSDYYTFAVTANNATGYTMTATPAGAQVGDRCGVYTLSNTAGAIAKTVSTAATGCW